MSSPDLSQFSMMDLFRTEAETQLSTLTAGLLALERQSASQGELESLMRAAHSLKGAARIVNLGVAVRVAHAMEDGFVAAQKGTLVLGRTQIDALLAGVDLLTLISHSGDGDPARHETEHTPAVDAFLVRLAAALSGNSESGAVASTPSPSTAGSAEAPAVATPVSLPVLSSMKPRENDSPSVVAPTPRVIERSERDEARQDLSQRVLRVRAEHVNRMLGLAGECLVESRWLRPFGQSLLKLKLLHADLAKSVDFVTHSLSGLLMDEKLERSFHDLRSVLTLCQDFLATRYTELDTFDRRSSTLSHNLYHEALACRMRPFADGLQGFPRMVRDLGRTLGKEVRLEIVGEETQVDRDILEKLEAPLNHLIRNAIDHGIESPQEREAAGKPKEGVLRLEARHSAGRLVISVSEDGRGIEIERVRKTIVRRGMTTAETAAKLTDSELLEFLFLPGFTVKEEVTEISGRGVGLDVVQSIVKSVRGTIRVVSERCKGTRFQLQLPLTLSVLRTLLVEIGGEPYAFPLAHVVRTLKVGRDQVEVLQGRQHFNLGDKQVGLVTAHQLFGSTPSMSHLSGMPVIIVGEGHQPYGLVVDRFLGERELVVQPLDPRLGKVKDISAGAIMEDGTPILIVDVEDIIRSIEKFSSEMSVAPLVGDRPELVPDRPKRVLIVDDSLTVRELEKKILRGRGYLVDCAVDGMDGWNVVRSAEYDLVISDVDMPRMDGLELVSLIKRDPTLRKIPALIVSYKDREDDRRRGLEAGADFYLSKGSFQDDTLARVVENLIGRAQP